MPPVLGLDWVSGALNTPVEGESVLVFPQPSRFIRVSITHLPATPVKPPPQDPGTQLSVKELPIRSDPQPRKILSQPSPNDLELRVEFFIQFLGLVMTIQFLVFVEP